MYRNMEVMVKTFSRASTFGVPAGIALNVFYCLLGKEVPKTKPKFWVPNSGDIASQGDASAELRDRAPSTSTYELRQELDDVRHRERESGVSLESEKQGLKRRIVETEKLNSA